MTRIMISECTCPACGIKLDTAPSRKKRCPYCEQFICVRTVPVDRRQYLVTEDEIEIIDQEWRQYHDNQANQPQHTEEKYERLFQMPLRFTIKKIQHNRSLERIFVKHKESVRWVLGSWCKTHCKRIAGYPSCTELEGEYDSWDHLPTVPSGQVACHSNEFWEWWDDYNNEQEKSWCDCHIEVFKDGVWQRGLMEGQTIN